MTAWGAPSFQHFCPLTIHFSANPGNFYATLRILSMRGRKLGLRRKAEVLAIQALNEKLNQESINVVMTGDR
jgi:hypothetical protein